MNWGDGLWAMGAASIIVWTNLARLGLPTSLGLDCQIQAAGFGNPAGAEG